LDFTKLGVSSQHVRVQRVLNFVLSFCFENILGFVFFYIPVFGFVVYWFFYGLHILLFTFSFLVLAFTYILVLFLILVILLGCSLCIWVLSEMDSSGLLINEDW